MAILDDVKRRVGVLYSDPNKDRELTLMIEGARQYFAGAGWKIRPGYETPIDVEALSLYVKMAQNMDAQTLTNHPIMTAFIAQNRAGGER